MMRHIHDSLEANIGFIMLVGILTDIILKIAGHPALYSWRDDVLTRSPTPPELFICRIIEFLHFIHSSILNWR